MQDTQKKPRQYYRKKHMLSPLLIVTALSSTILVYAKEKRVTHTDAFVGFSAGLAQPTSLPGNSSLPFDHVWLNSGDGYDNLTGVFTCPRAGTYVFIFHGLADTSGTLSLGLYRNGQYEISSYAHNTGNYASASNSAVLTLAYGDRVYVQGQGTVTLYGASDEVYSTFSGFILYPSQSVNTTVNSLYVG